MGTENFACAGELLNIINWKFNLTHFNHVWSGKLMGVVLWGTSEAAHNTTRVQSTLLSKMALQLPEERIALRKFKVILQCFLDCWKGIWTKYLHIIWCAGVTSIAIYICFKTQWCSSWLADSYINIFYSVYEIVMCENTMCQNTRQWKKIFFLKYGLLLKVLLISSPLKITYFQQQFQKIWNMRQGIERKSMIKEITFSIIWLLKGWFRHIYNWDINSFG